MRHITKQRWLTLIFVGLVLFSTSCNAKHPIEEVSFAPSDYQVFYYSTNSNPKIENEYLTAIWDLKQDYPEQLDSIERKKTTKEAAKRKEIGEYPSLVIVKDGETISTLSGDTKKSEVLQQLLKTVN